MSAWRVSPEHVVYMVKAMKAYGEDFYTEKYFDKKGGEVWFANYLLQENYRSVNYRYKEKDRPEEITRAMFDKWNWKLNLIQTIKTTHCYEYQTCEHPEWDGSMAEEFCKALASCCLHALPGYSEAEWGVPDPLS